MAPQPNKRKTYIGKVVSDKPHKSIVVAIPRTIKHPVYGKRITKTTKIMAHDPTNQCRQGDRVAITPTRPLSARKRHRLSHIIA